MWGHTNMPPRLSGRRASRREESSPLRGHAARVPGTRRVARAAGRGGEGGGGVERSLLVAAGQSSPPAGGAGGGGGTAGGQKLRPETAAAVPTRTRPTGPHGGRW